MYITYEVGDKLTIKGTIKYWADFSSWEYEFPEDLVFTVDSVTKDSYTLVAYGFGDRKSPYDPESYGNGAIFVDKKYEPNLIPFEKYIKPPIDIHNQVLIP